MMRAVALLCVGVALVGCGGDKVSSGTEWVTANGQPAPPPPPPPPPKPALPANSITVEFTESDFAEGERSRDPFRGFASGGAVNTKAVINQRNVLVADYTLDDLKLIAIVQGGEQPLAMLVDPKGKGTTVHRGDFIGRSEIARTGGVGSTEYQVNWRVDRIRPSDVVFVREDPAQPTAAPVTRVLTIHPESEETPATPK
jgi:type IV pilus assembly protein PilP